MTNQDSKKFEHTNHRRPAKNMIILEKRKNKKRERERERERGDGDQRDMKPI